MTNKHFNGGEVIFRQGEEGNSFFQVLDGSVSVILDYGQENALVLTSLKKGDFLGEMAVIEAYARSATAVAGEEGADLREITSDEADNYLGKDPELCLTLMKHLGSRLSDLSLDYEEVANLILEIDNDPELGNKKNLMEKAKKQARLRRKVSKTVDHTVNDAILLERYGEHSKGFSKKVNQYPAGTVICKEGMSGSCMYDIHWGTIGIYRGYGTEEEVKLTELYPNTFFGEMGLISNTQRSATAVALTDATLEVILEEDLKELFEKNPPKACMILAHLSNRLRDLTMKYESACELASNVLDSIDGGVPVPSELASQIKEFAKKQ